MAYDPKAFPPFAVTVDLVVLTIDDGTLAALCQKRTEAPFKGQRVLPGGFVGPEESLKDAARRKLSEKTGITDRSLFLEQLQTFGSPSRDPRMRIVSVSYLAFVPVHRLTGLTAKLRSVKKLLNKPMGFDHHDILKVGVERARSKLEYTTLATAFCPQKFTISQLRGVYEAAWGETLDPRNFNRKARKSAGFVEPISGKVSSGVGRPAQLYQRGRAERLSPPLMRGGLADLS